jgi:hypothetical protein
MKHIFLTLLLVQVSFGFTDSLKVISREIYKCTDDTSVYVKISYPQLANLKNIEVQNKINRFLESQFLQALQSYEEFISDSTSLSLYPADWVFNFEVTFETTFLSDDFFSVRMDYYEFTGGAHGNYFSVGFNFRLSDGELLKLTDIIKENQLNNLSLFCEQEILKKFNAYSLSEAGLFEDEIRLTSEQDFFIKPNFLVIQFDPYEIAAYAVGSIEVELSFNRIKNLLKPNLPFQ